MFARLAAVLFCLTLGGCVASALNQRTADRYEQAGHAAAHAGNWDAAVAAFSRAVVNADIGHLSDDEKARVAYEYGRALGVVCQYREAEKYLLQSKTLAAQAGRPPYLALYELALLHEKEGNASAAAENFSALFPLIEQQNLKERAPLGVADIYERYATVLRTMDKTAEAGAADKEAEAIRTANPNANPIGTATPYGTACHKAA